VTANAGLYFENFAVTGTVLVVIADPRTLRRALHPSCPRLASMPRETLIRDACREIQNDIDLAPES
jgi:hypothetical protein